MLVVATFVYTVLAIRGFDKGLKSKCKLCFVFAMRGEVESPANKIDSCHLPLIAQMRPLLLASRSLSILAGLDTLGVGSEIISITPTIRLSCI